VTAVPDDRGGTLARLPERYQVEHVIGRGGTAVVYAARDTLLNRPVAIKVFLVPTDSAQVLREQQHEARTLAGLSHHALVTLFDAGVDDADPDRPHIYLVMERVDGPDLAQRLRSGALNPTQVGYLGADLCDALLYVHEQGYLHRDIKPANVLLTQRESERRIRGKLSDFGIAAVLGTSGDEGEFTVGTAAYLSPEQVEGAPLEAPSDTYSLGLVLTQAATGRVAFPGTVIESAFARLDRDPEIPDFLPARMAGVLRSMTERKPENRIGLEQARAEFEGALGEVLIERVRKAARPAPVQEPEPSPAQSRTRTAKMDALPPDAEFLRITGTAARLLRAPGAFVAVGADGAESFACVPEVHRAAITALAVRCLADDTTRAWTVEEVAADTRTAGVVGAAPIHALAVQPLVAADGRTVGVLGVLDAVPRRFTEEELMTLADLGHLVAHEFDLRQAVRRAIFAR
jgi:hypothetical protein